MQHHHPVHRLRKRSTFSQTIKAKRRERVARERIAKEQGEHTHHEQLHERLAVRPEQESVPTSPLPGAAPLEGRDHSLAEDLHDWVLGGQDGLVNVLGSILGVAIVTTNKYIILVAGLAALFAESISLAAVAYTSVKASHSYYHSQHAAMRAAIRENPVLQREILIDVYERKGLTRADAAHIVAELTKDESVWTNALMHDHLRMYTPEEAAPLHSSIIVGLASLLGALVPLTPFFFLTGITAIIVSCVASLIVLFFAGAASAKLTIGDWKSRGFEMASIGMSAALVSFIIGLLFMRLVGAQ